MMKIVFSQFEMNACLQIFLPMAQGAGQYGLFRRDPGGALRVPPHRDAHRALRVRRPI